MGFTFRIGRPSVEKCDVVGDPVISATTKPVSTVVDETVHADEYEGSPYEGSSKRSISYTTWWNVLEGVDGFESLWERMRGRYEHHNWVPVEYYVDELDDLEERALDMLEGEPRVSENEARKHDSFDNPVLEEEGSEEAGIALRTLWFVRWSRTAYEEFGDEAVFETPGEWK